MTLLQKIILGMAAFNLFTASSQAAVIPGAPVSVNTAATCPCGLTNWTKFSPPNARFEILMPQAPVKQTVTNQAPVGRVVSDTWMAEPSGVLAFAINVHHYPTNSNFGDKNQVLQMALQGAVGKTGKLVYDNAIMLQGHPGHESRIEKENGQAVVTMRVFVIDTDLYQVMTVMSKAKFCPTHVRLFLDSFKFTNEEKSAGQAR